MSWKSYFFPQTILITSSSYNHHIRINEEWGKMKLIVNGSPQSGAYIAHLWKHAFNHFSIGSHKAGNALVLGVGGGTVMTLLSSYFPGIKQTCVDIDNVILDVAKKYFFIHSIQNIVLIHADVKTYMKQLIRSKKTYDCIIVDLYIGGRVPTFIEQKYFILHLEKLLSKEGFLCMNYLREKEYEMKSDKLFMTLQSVFPTVSDYRIARNRFFWCK
jgi:spermidine synthase